MAKYGEYQRFIELSRLIDLPCFRLFFAFSTQLVHFSC